MAVERRVIEGKNGKKMLWFQLVKRTIGLFALVLASAPAVAAQSFDPRAQESSAEQPLPDLRSVLSLAAEHAPEVAFGRAALNASHSSYASARLAPLGNPYLEVTAERGSKSVTRDVAVNAALWLPLEISGQRESRRREAEGFVSLHQALLGQARTSAFAQAIRSYGALAVACKRAEVLRQVVNDARVEAKVYAERVAAGDAVERDAALASVEAARNEVLLSEAEADQLKFSRELEGLTGRRFAVTSPSVELSPPGLKGDHFRPERAAQSPQVLLSQAEARYFQASGERFQREGRSPLSIGLIGGRGDFGEARLGGGLAYAIPLFRSNQPEQARAKAERERALAELAIKRRVIQQRVIALRDELSGVARALDLLAERALPAAERALRAAEETHRVGKADWLGVLVSRRDRSSLSLRRLELLDRSWMLVSELVELTGELP